MNNSTSRKCIQKKIISNVKTVQMEHKQMSDLNVYRLKQLFMANLAATHTGHDNYSTWWTVVFHDFFFGGSYRSCTLVLWVMGIFS